MSKIKVIVVEPNKEPYIKEIEHTLENLQSLVGGLIEFINLEDDIDIICNEEGKLKNLEFNRILGNDIIAGTFIIAGVNQKKGATISIPENKIKKYLDMFKLDKHMKKVDYMKSEFIESGNLAYMKIISLEKGDDDNKK